MKKNIIIACILGAISLVCAFAIAGINYLTADKILASSTEKEVSICQSIFEDYDEKNSEVLSDLSGLNKDSRIVKIITARDSTGTTLGTIYTVAGSNDYGNITLMIAIKDSKVIQVEFLENTQSFKSTVNDHVKGNYPSSKDSVIYPLIKPLEQKEVSALDKDAVDEIDVKCGATYGATLVKNLVDVALNDAKGGK